MKLRLITAAALAAGLVLSVSGAEAATPTMDGKRVKVLKITGTSGVEEHDVDLTGTGPDPIDCGKPRCLRLQFVYKPAKGVKGGLMFTAKWSTPGTDIDLFVGEVGKNGRATRIAACASTGPPSEKVFLAPSKLRSGKTYVMVLDYFRAVNEKVTGTIEMTTKSSVATTMPPKAEDVKKVNCTL